MSGMAMGVIMTVSVPVIMIVNMIMMDVLVLIWVPMRRTCNDKAMRAAVRFGKRRL